MTCHVILVVYLMSSAIMDEFFESQATTGNKISDERGQRPKTTYDQMSVMYGEHIFMLPRLGLEQTVQKFGGR